MEGASVPSSHGKRPPRDEAERLLRSEMAKSLRAYQSLNPELKTISQLSARTGVDRETLGRILRQTTTPSAKSRAKLYQVTQAEVFRNPRTRKAKQTSSVSGSTRTPGIEDLLNEVKRLSLSVERLHMSLSPADEASSEGKMLTEKVSVRARAQAVARILGELDRELAFFKQESKQDARHVLRSVVDAKDVGYLIALLKAMYDDDAFENWIFGAQYGAGSK